MGLKCSVSKKTIVPKNSVSYISHNAPQQHLSLDNHCLLCKCPLLSNPTPPVSNVDILMKAKSILKSL